MSSLLKYISQNSKMYDFNKENTNYLGHKSRHEDCHKGCKCHRSYQEFNCGFSCEYLLKVENRTCHFLHSWTKAVCLYRVKAWRTSFDTWFHVIFIVWNCQLKTFPTVQPHVTSINCRSRLPITTVAKYSCVLLYIDCVY